MGLTLPEFLLVAIVSFLFVVLNIMITMNNERNQY